MIHKNKLLKKKETSILKQKGSLEFLITTFLISLLTIMGIFMSHYNKDRLITENSGISTLVIPSDTIGKGVSMVSNKKIDAAFRENMTPDVDVKETRSNTEKSIILVASHPYFGQDQRSIESWNTTTEKAGIAIKFGRGLTMTVPEKVVD